MAVRLISNTLGRKSTNSRVSQSEIEVFNNQDHAPAFQNEAGNLELFDNENNFYRLRQRITEIVKFYSLFTIVEGIYVDMARIKGLFEGDKEKSYNYLGQSLNNVDMKINSLESEIERVKIDLSALDNEIIRRQTTGVALSYNESQMSEATLGMTSLNRARTLVDSARLKQMLEAKTKARLITEKEVFPENLKILYEQKDVLLSDMRNKLEISVEEFYGRWVYIEQYYQKIQSIGNPLENQYPIEVEELISLTDHVLPCFEQLHKTRLILFDLEQDVIFKDKLIDINYEISNKKVQIAAQIAAKPYLESLLDMINEKFKNYKAQYRTYVTTDRVDHLTICVEDLNQNFNDLTTDIGRISGSVNKVTGHVSISANIRPLKQARPRNFGISEEAKEASKLLEECQIEKTQYEKEYNLLEEYKRDLIMLENKRNSLTHERAAEREALNKFFLDIAISYQQLLATRANFADREFINTFIYDTSMLDCLLGVIIKYITIAKKPGCCSFGSVPDHLAVDITANELIRIFVKILGEVMKVKTGCYSGNDLDKLYSCTNIDLNDLINLVLNTRVMGSLRDDHGNKQKVTNGERSQLINCSLFFYLREMMTVKALQYAYLYKINFNQTCYTIKTYENSLIQTLHHLNYVKIASKAEYHKVIKK